MKQTHGYLVLKRLAILLPLIAWLLTARGGELYDLASGLHAEGVRFRASPSCAGGDAPGATAAAVLPRKLQPQGWQEADLLVRPENDAVKFGDTGGRLFWPLVRIPLPLIGLAVGLGAYAMISSKIK